METIKVQTQNGTNYTIDLDGCFLQYNQHTWEHPHNTWKCCGVAERKKFNHMHYYNLSQFITLLRNKQITTYKNSSARYYIEDIDNGTHRLQMDGIAKAWIS
ncbi:hypothetical protein LCGC14_0972810 [marine sediment metagenome]|uniref:Uncharacterized protein n=1 Tax=marine sediment metagenome TaxID=412755 RepID=A0A0F9NFI6_9ZZZZ